MVTNTDLQTELGKIATLLHGVEDEQTPLQSVTVIEVVLPDRRVTLAQAAAGHLVQSPGSYETRNYPKFGAGLMAITLAIVAVLVPLMWPSSIFFD